MSARRATHRGAGPKDEHAAHAATALAAGRFRAEPTLRRLAAQIEEARPWVGRTPPVCA